MKKTPLLIALLFFLSFLSSKAQKATFFESSKIPAEPFGGKKEVQLLFENSMVYPKTAFEKGAECEIFVLFKVDKEGKIHDLNTKNCNNEEIQDEAKRLVNLILWEKNEIRQEGKIGMEKIKIDFSKKKYEKLIKKRIKTDDSVTFFQNTTYYNPKILDSPANPKKYTTINDFVVENMKYPSLALQQGISGKVTVKFIVEPYGGITNVKIIKAVGGGCNEETIRLLRSIKWKPGVLSGKAVRSLNEYSLNFVHPGGTFR